MYNRGYRVTSLKKEYYNVTNTNSTKSTCVCTKMEPTKYGIISIDFVRIDDGQ